MCWWCNPAADAVLHVVRNANGPYLDLGASQGSQAVVELIDLEPWGPKKSISVQTHRFQAHAPIRSLTPAHGGLLSMGAH